MLAKYFFEAFDYFRYVKRSFNDPNWQKFNILEYITILSIPDIKETEYYDYLRKRKVEENLIQDAFYTASFLGEEYQGKRDMGCTLWKNGLVNIKGCNVLQGKTIPQDLDSSDEKELKQALVLLAKKARKEALKDNLGDSDQFGIRRGEILSLSDFGLYQEEKVKAVLLELDITENLLNFLKEQKTEEVALENAAKKMKSLYHEVLKRKLFLKHKDKYSHKEKEFTSVYFSFLQEEVNALRKLKAFVSDKNEEEQNAILITAEKLNALNSFLFIVLPIIKVICLIKNSEDNRFVEVDFRTLAIMYLFEQDKSLAIFREDRDMTVLKEILELENDMASEEFKQNKMFWAKAVDIFETTSILDVYIENKSIEKAVETVPKIKEKIKHDQNWNFLKCSISDKKERKHLINLGYEMIRHYAPKMNQYIDDIMRFQ